MVEVVLYEPEIPPNTGNIIRLCANTGAGLHLVEPLGFSLRDAQLKRAGLDYHEYANVITHPNWAHCQRSLQNKRVFAVSTRGLRRYDDILYRKDDVFLFGPETRGLPQELLASFPSDQRVRIPMQPGNRSLNLSNAVAVVVYEVWRQLGFPGDSNSPAFMGASNSGTSGNGAIGGSVG